VLGNPVDFIWLFCHECRKFLQTARFWLIFLFSVIPSVIFIDLITEAASNYRDFSNLLTFKNTVLGAFVLYIYFYDIIVSLIVASDGLSGEKAYSLLFLHSRKIYIFMAKLTSGFIIITVSNVISSVGLLVVSLTWNVPLILGDYIQVLFINLLLCATPYTFSILNHSISLRFSNIPKTLANYAVLFFFFIMPFIVYYISLQLYIFDPNLMNITLLPKVQEIVNFYYSSSIKPELITIQQNILDLAFILPVAFGIPGTIFFLTTEKI